VTITKCLVSKI